VKGTIVNVIAVVIGSLFGLFFRKFFTKDMEKIIMQGLGLSVIVLGTSMAIKTQNFIILIFSIVIGGIVGELLNIDKSLNNFAMFIKKKTKSKEGKFIQGFVTAFLIFCVGSLTIMGAIEEGVNGNPDLLYTKSMLDLFTAIALSSVLGVGVLFSIIPLFLFQGLLTLGALFISRFLTDLVINEISAVGGVLIIGIGLNHLKIQKIKLINLLPAILIAAILSLVFV